MPKNSKNLIDAADDTDSFRSTTSESESSRGKNNKNNEPKDAEEQPIPCLKQSPDGQSHWSILPVGLAMGAAFGFALQKGEVYLPMRIANQFTLRDFTVFIFNYHKILLFKCLFLIFVCYRKIYKFGKKTKKKMLKMFLSASVTSSLVFSVGYLLVPDHFKAMRSSCSGERKTLKETATGTVFSVLENVFFFSVFSIFQLSQGAGLLGVGMAVAGSCPGNVLVQIGSGLVPAFLIFACGLFGAFLCEFSIFFFFCFFFFTRHFSFGVCSALRNDIHSTLSIYCSIDGILEGHGIPKKIFGRLPDKVCSC